ncbi:MAG: phage portal protein, partial [Raoultibacter sp.]
MNIIEQTKSAFSSFGKRTKSANSRNQGQLDEWRKLAEFLGLDSDKPEALSESTYYVCMRVLSESIGKLPCKLLAESESSGVITTMRRERLHYLVNVRPNPFMTATSFWGAVEMNRSHCGNAYVLIDGAGDRQNLWILPSESITVWFDDAMIISEVPDVFYLYSVGGKTYKFASEEILHFRSSSTLDGIVGVSVIDRLSAMVNGSFESQRLLNNLYENGLTSKLAVQYTGNLSDENVDKFVAGLEKYTRRSPADEGTRNVIPIPPGATITPLNMKLSDSQFIDIRKYSALQIAAGFGVKPSQINDYTKSSYASQAEQQLSFYVDTLLFPIKQYEEELNYKLLTSDQVSKGFYFKFNINAILRADGKT